MAIPHVDLPLGINNQSNRPKIAITISIQTPTSHQKNAPGPEATNCVSSKAVWEANKSLGGCYFSAKEKGVSMELPGALLMANWD